jgi:hypothetical protein
VIADQTNLEIGGDLYYMDDRAENPTGAGKVLRGNL